MSDDVIIPDSFCNIDLGGVVGIDTTSPKSQGSVVARIRSMSVTADTLYQWKQMTDPTKAYKHAVDFAWDIELNTTLQSYILELQEQLGPIQQLLESYLKNGKTWADVVKSDNPQADQFVNFRNNLVTTIDKQICSICYDDTTCPAPGSKDMTSDVDITVSNDDLLKAIETHVVIYKFLEQVFQNMLQPQTAHKLEDILAVFDVNFYLSNFDIDKGRLIPMPGKQKTINTIDMRNVLASYDYSDSPNSQIYYAMYNVLEGKTCARGFIYNKVVDMLAAKAAFEKKRLRQWRRLGANDQVLLKDRANKNAVIALMSEVTTSQCESYHTQGSYFHVVRMLQQQSKLSNHSTNPKYGLFMIASGIENACFYFDNPEKIKYLYRHLDACRRLKQWELELKQQKQSEVNVFQHIPTFFSLLAEEVKFGKIAKDFETYALTQSIPDDYSSFDHFKTLSHDIYQAQVTTLVNKWKSMLQGANGGKRFPRRNIALKSPRKLRGSYENLTKENNINIKYDDKWTKTRHCNVQTA